MQSSNQTSDDRSGVDSRLAEMLKELKRLRRSFRLLALASILLAAGVVTASLVYVFASHRVVRAERFELVDRQTGAVTVVAFGDAAMAKKLNAEQDARDRFGRGAMVGSVKLTPVWSDDGSIQILAENLAKPPDVREARQRSLRRPERAKKPTHAKKRRKSRGRRMLTQVAATKGHGIGGDGKRGDE
ncbi:MAG: hypothetical protein GXP29_07320 [Planctomycetes bacterium]|nr:hypothetical protein [Planctomycetota bacterium]